MSIFIGFVGAMAGLFAVIVFALYWMYEAPFGPLGVADRTEEQIHVSYNNKQYQDVVDLYETPMKIAMHRDRTLEEQTYVHDDIRILVANSYVHLGLEDLAQHQYLAILGWNGAEYEALCVLATDDSCNDGSLLKTMAYKSILTKD